ncbi:MAG: DNA repair protein RecN [Alistipes sp.]|jgi:DNA repair protein RecN (Recombination protein N)|nr:DNA repair protein RecN [Alistipes sp.]
MLISLTVENYALIERLEMTLGPGLNIVTGETGAGKSILLGALGLLLGSRGEAGVQKDPARTCVVEGVFALDGYGLEGFFEENDLDLSPECTVRRVISAAGKSRAYVGDLPVGLSVLKALGDKLIDIHSQHENLLLRDEGFRVSILDSVAGQSTLVKRYGGEFAQWRTLTRQLTEARTAATEARRDEEWLRHQAEELAALRLTAGEVEALENEQRELSHSDELREAFGLAAGELGADETGIISRLAGLRTALDRVGTIHPGAAAFSERLAAGLLDLRDMEREAATEQERIEGNPERLAAVVARLDAIYGLQQKHRASTVGELLELQARFAAQLGAIDHSDERLAELEAAVAATEAEVTALAAQVSAGRRGAAGAVERAVCDMLRRLGMPEVRFEVEIAPAEALRPGGGDEVRFMFSAVGAVGTAGTPGTPAAPALRPIEKIASGGEISRVMLALKSLAARSAGQPTVVFDEIDAGISGRVADAMGEVIAELGTHSQVINITHLPQIAAKRGTHFLVYKESGTTRIRPLGQDERALEIAKMLSGNTVTPAALHHARQLLGED